MARFRIDRTTRAADGRRSVFVVEWLDGALSVGDTFPAYEAGHTFQVTVVAITPRESGAELLCDFTLGWTDQFAPAVVDTDASQPFRYLHESAIPGRSGA